MRNASLQRDDNQEWQRHLFRDSCCHDQQHLDGLSHAAVRCDTGRDARCSTGPTPRSWTRRRSWPCSTRSTVPWHPATSALRQCTQASADPWHYRRPQMRPLPQSRPSPSTQTRPSSRRSSWTAALPADASCRHLMASASRASRLKRTGQGACGWLVRRRRRSTTTRTASAVVPGPEPGPGPAGEGGRRGHGVKLADAAPRTQYSSLVSSMSRQRRQRCSSCSTLAQHRELRPLPVADRPGQRDLRRGGRVRVRHLPKYSDQLGSRSRFSGRNRGAAPRAGSAGGLALSYLPDSRPWASGLWAMTTRPCDLANGSTSRSVERATRL